MPPDPLAALTDQLAACGEQLTQLDAREAAHYTALTALLAGLAAHPAPGEDPDSYQPGPPPPWWKLTPDDRHEPVARLRGWVEQVYRPGYGHLAATLAPAGRPTTCACTAWTSWPTCGPPSTSSPAAPPAC